MLLCCYACYVWDVWDVWVPKEGGGQVQITSVGTLAMYNTYSELAG